MFFLACSGATPPSGDSPPDTSAPDTADTTDRAPPDTGDTAAPEDTAPPDPATLDQDGDHYTPAEGDCDDTRAHVHPHAKDLCDGLDQDCDGEPIPDGSCSAEWDVGRMWSWSVVSASDTHPSILVAGDVAGGLEADLLMNSWVDEPYQEVVSLLSGPAGAWPAEQGWPEPFTGEGDSNLVILSPVPVIDSTGDGRGDLWVITESGGFEGGAFLFRGADAGFGPDFERLDTAADASWVDGGGVSLADDPRSGSGDLTGDGLTDLALRTKANGDELLAILPGDPGLSGTHRFSELPAMYLDLDQTHATAGGLVGDLDGDGLADAGMSVVTADVDPVAFLAGNDFSDGGHLLDAESLVYNGSRDAPLTLGEAAYAPERPGDMDGDGLDDGYLTGRTEEGDGCAMFTSGGIPAGELADWEFARVCGATAYRWIDDPDGGGGRVPMLGGTVVQASRLQGGGRFELADVMGANLGWSVHLETTADLDGDGYPEWVFDDRDYAPNGRELIVKGFPIPWEDASKW